MEEDQIREGRERHEEPSGERVSHEGVERLRALLGSRPVVMLTTMEPGGSLRSRPMAIQEINDQGEAFLITQRSSPKVEEVAREHHVNLAFFRTVRGRYVSVSGRATVMRDDTKLRQLWHPTLQAWFPDGLDDPDLCLLRVRIDKAETWNAPVGNLIQVARLAGSILGRSPRPTHEEGRDTLVIRVQQPGIGDTAGILGAAGGNMGVAPRAPREPGKARVVGASGGTMGEAPINGKKREAPTAPRAARTELPEPRMDIPLGARTETVTPPKPARAAATAENKAMAGEVKKHAQIKPEPPIGDAAPRRGGRGR
ncbi:MAG: pyridoxamine 5'-phosphate oxidase family protein [Myxococcota bacterium]